MPTYIFDDIYGDQRPGAPSQVPIYLPTTDQWDPLGGTCPQCSLKTNLPIPIDPTQAQNGTWHTVTVNPGEPTTTLSITFTGTGVTAFCMLPPTFGQWITSSMNMSFQLDGAIVGSYTRPTAVTEQWTYHYPVYSTSGLDNGEHTFVIQPLPGADSSYLVFDYIEYEFEDPAPSSTGTGVQVESSSPPTTGDGGGGTVSGPGLISKTMTSTSSLVDSQSLVQTPTDSAAEISSSNSPRIVSSHLTSSVSGSSTAAMVNTSPTNTNTASSTVSQTSSPQSIPPAGVSRTERSTIPKSAVVGSVVGGTVAFLILALFLLRCIVKRRAIHKRRRAMSKPAIVYVPEYQQFPFSHTDQPRSNVLRSPSIGGGVVTLPPSVEKKDDITEVPSSSPVEGPPAPAESRQDIQEVENVNEQETAENRVLRREVEILRAEVEMLSAGWHMDDRTHSEPLPSYEQARAAPVARS